MNKIVRFPTARRAISIAAGSRAPKAPRRVQLTCAWTVDVNTGCLVCTWASARANDSLDDRPCIGRDGATRSAGSRVAA